MAGHHGTRVKWNDRDRLDSLIRPIVAAMGMRGNIPLLAGRVASALAECEVDSDEDTEEWLQRVRDGALLDFLYNRVALEVARQKPITVTVGKSKKRDVSLRPYQGVRMAQEREFQQISFLDMTKAEYTTWRKQELAAIKAQSGKVQVIQALDVLWDEYPDAGTVRALMEAAGINLGGPRIQLVG